MRIQVSNDVAACVPGLRAVAVVLTGNREHADDLLEEAITWFFTDPPTPPPTAGLKALLFSLLHDLHCIGGHRSDSGADAPASRSSRQDSLVSDNFRIAFWRLSGDEREMLILEEASGLSSEEVATICGCTRSMLDICVSRARQKLVQAPCAAIKGPRIRAASSHLQLQ
jgi:RNA polymerase sigma-70 factor, ECF subfamily